MYAMAAIQMWSHNACFIHLLIHVYSCFLFFGGGRLLIQGIDAEIVHWYLVCYHDLLLATGDRIF